MIETWFSQDLQNAVPVRTIEGNVFSMDNNGNKIGVRVFNNGQAANLSGSISANVIRADGATVAVSGTASGNEAWIVLPQTCYAVPGVITVILKNTVSSDVTTLLAVVANVYRSSTDSAVDPGTVIPSIETLIAAIEAAVATVPADYASLTGYTKDILSLESGTYSDSDGTTKTASTARQRNRSPLWVGNIAGLTIPSGYECYVFCLDGTLSKIGTVNWTNTYLNMFNCTSGTEYINIVFRSISSPSSDISSVTLLPGIIWQGAESTVPIWNVAPYGIYIDGFDVVVNQNGFGFKVDKNVYYIAPTDMETVTRFTPSNINNPYVLVVDITKLTNGVRNNPGTVMKITESGDRDLNSGRYAVVAEFHTGQWYMVCDFAWMDKPRAKAVNGILLQTHIIAHKGGSAAEANTMANFTAAYNAGYKAVECDVQFTSDGVMVLCHDASFTVGSTTYVIASNTYAALVAVKPNLAKFEDLLKLCKRTDMIIDVDFTKTYTTAQTEALYAMIAQYGAQSRCMITCFANTARQLLGHEPMCVCISSVTSTSAADAIYDIMQRAALCFCSISYESVTQALMNYIHGKGALVKVWTVNTAANAKNYITMGADMVISDSLTDSVVTDLT